MTREAEKLLEQLTDVASLQLPHVAAQEARAAILQPYIDAAKDAACYKTALTAIFQRVEHRDEEAADLAFRALTEPHTFAAGEAEKGGGA